MRPSGRKIDQMRKVSFERNFSKHAEGSCLVKFGDTHVLCTASLEERRRHGCAIPARAGSRPNTACCRGRPANA